ncbi:MAG: methionine--tRNA ligase, partial [Candidatus Dormibacteria bacterium]
FSAQRLHRMLGHEGEIAPMPGRQRHDGADPHLVLTGDYGAAHSAWAPPLLPPGQALGEPEPLFRKLDAEIIDQELERMQAAEVG